MWLILAGFPHSLPSSAMHHKGRPAYHRASASLRRRQGIGGVAAAAMASRSWIDYCMPQEGFWSRNAAGSSPRSLNPDRHRRHAVAVHARCVRLGN